MNPSFYIKLVYTFNVILSVCKASFGLPQEKSGAFSIVSSLLDSVNKFVLPMIASGSNRCEDFKDLLKITYDKMQEKNMTELHRSLKIDFITKNGSVKYNITAPRKISRILRNASKVVILIHGFMESSDGEMAQSLSTELMKQPGLKIMALDGRKIINYEYLTATTYARFMGEKLGEMLISLIDSGQDPSKFHLIGHSLGAHIAGIAGKQVRQSGRSLGRVTGLDPAGPCFTGPGVFRLDRGDAEFVDVVHTNAGYMGFMAPLGHLDFYPNEGVSQPGCYTVFCSHSRAWEIFSEAISKPNNFPARKCKNWTAFTGGLCSQNEVSYMGMNSRLGNEGLYFFTTASSLPFGLGAAGSG